MVHDVYSRIIAFGIIFTLEYPNWYEWFRPMRSIVMYYFPQID